MSTNAEALKEPAPEWVCEAWVATLFRGFVESILVNLFELVDGYEGRSVSSLAYSVRNLLELSVWLRYLNERPADARRFVGDLVRDIHTFVKLGGQFKLSSEEARAVARMREIVDSIAELASIEDATGPYLDLNRDASKFLNDPSITLGFRFLSKFAHPTALSMFVMLSPESQRSLREMLRKEGFELATLCFDKYKELRDRLAPHLSSFVVQDAQRILARQRIDSLIPPALREKISKILNTDLSP